MSEREHSPLEAEVQAVVRDARRDAYLSAAAAVAAGLLGLAWAGAFLLAVNAEQVAESGRGHISADIFLSAVVVVLGGVIAIGLSGRARRRIESFGLSGGWLATMGTILGGLALASVPILIYLSAWIPRGPS